MHIYSDYGDEERRLLLASLEAAAVAISAASPGRGEETASEGFAAASFVLEHRVDYVGSTLITSVIAEIETRLEAERPFPDYVKVAAAPGARDWAMVTLRSVTALLDARADPAEAAAYKGWLMRLAWVVAGAGKEDQGFLGMGGVSINEAERAALEAIAETLGTSLEPPGRR